MATEKAAKAFATRRATRACGLQQIRLSDIHRLFQLNRLVILLACYFKKLVVSVGFP